MNKQLGLIKCWGKDIDNEYEKSKLYLSYIIHKEDFSFIKNGIDIGIDLKQFKYIEMNYNQLTKQITLECRSDFKDMILRISKKINFFRIIADIEDKC